MKDSSATPTLDLKSIMLDVRHSWRVAAASQQKNFYLLRRFEAENPELQFIYWGPAWNKRLPSSSTRPWDRWNWDFLPLYAADYWFAPNGTKVDSKLNVGDWFVAIRISIDDGYHDEVEETASFKGPDPIKMPAVEDSASTIEVYLYEVTREAGKELTHSEIWEADEGDREYEGWAELPHVGVRAITLGGALEDYLEDSAITALIAQFRAIIGAAGLLTHSGMQATS